MKVEQPLGLRGPWRRGARRDRTASNAGVVALAEAFFQPLVAGDQKASGQAFSAALPVQALRGLLAWGPSLSFSTSGTQRGPVAGVLLCKLAYRALKGAP